MRKATLLKSDTRHQANISIQPHKSRLEAMVLAELKERGPAICDELEEELGLSHQCCSARLSYLRDRGLIYDTNVRAKTRSGRLAIIWGLRK
jgi:predicted transcriptional regulator